MKSNRLHLHCGHLGFLREEASALIGGEEGGVWLDGGRRLLVKIGGPVVNGNSGTASYAWLRELLPSWKSPKRLV